MSWTRLGPETISTEQIEQVSTAVTEPLNIALGIADLSIDALELAQVLVLGAENLTAVALNEAINAIEASVEEAMECNLSTFLHMNINWDPTWDLDTFKEQGRWPWAGTGLQGWGLDVMSSLHDTSDPMRPLTDEDTNVWGLLFVVGLPGFDQVGEMANAAGAFGDFSDFLEVFDPERIEQYGEQWRGLSRMGSAFVDPFVRDATGKSDVLERMKEQWVAVGRDVTDLDGYVPTTAGSYPHWYSAPMQALIPPVEAIFGALKNLLNGLRPPLGQLDLIGDLLAAIRQRTAYLRFMIERLEEAILALTALVNFISQAYVYIIDTEQYGEGIGLDGAIAAATADPDAPDYGDDGIVVGIGMFATAGNMAAPLEAFWSLLGMQASSYADVATTRAQNIEDSYDELFAP